MLCELLCGLSLLFSISVFAEYRYFSSSDEEDRKGGSMYPAHSLTRSFTSYLQTLRLSAVYLTTQAALPVPSCVSSLLVRWHSLLVGELGRDLRLLGCLLKEGREGGRGGREGERGKGGSEKWGKGGREE